MPMDRSLYPENMKSPDWGPCCVCEKTGPEVRNILCLNRKGPTPGKGWGCFVCGLPRDGATAVLCDKCLEAEAEIVYVCTGYPALDGRTPIAELPHEAFEHDLSYHPEASPEMYGMPILPGRGPYLPLGLGFCAIYRGY